MQTFREFTNKFGDRKHKACMRFEDAIRKNQKELRDRPQTDVRKTDGVWEVFISHSLDHIEVPDVQRFHTRAMRDAKTPGAIKYKIDRKRGYLTGIFRPK